MLYAVAFLVALAGGTSSLGVIFFAKSVLSASPGQIGFLMAVWSVFYVCGCLSYRSFAAKLPPHYSILIATFVSCLCIGMIFRLQSLFWAFVLYAFAGFAISLFWPVVMGWLSAGLEGKQLNRMLGWFNLSWSSGSIMGPIVAGWLEDMGNSFALRGASLTYFLAASSCLLGILWLPGFRAKIIVPTQAPDSNCAGYDGTFLRYPAWISAFVSFFAIGTITAVIPLAAGADLNISKKTVGLLLLLRLLMMSCTLFGMGQMTRWHFRGKQIIVGALVGGFTAVFLAFTRSTGLIGLILAIVGVIVGHAYANSLFHGISGAADKSWRSAINEIIVNAGLIMGSISGGLAYGAFGITAAYSICAAIWVLDIIVTGMLLNLMRKRDLA